MKIIFVMGPAMSGKTVYATNQFPGATHISIETYKDLVTAAETNSEIESIARNIESFCLDSLVEAINNAKEDDVIVFEHPMLGKADRAFFIKGVREVTDAPIECKLMSPDEETLHKMLFGQPLTIKIYEYEKGLLETPETDEGFESVEAVNPVLLYDFMNETE